MSKATATLSTPFCWHCSQLSQLSQLADVSYWALVTCHLSSSAPKSCSKDDPPEEQNSGGSQRRQGPKGLQTAAVSNDHWLGCLAGLRAYSLDLLYNIHAICHTAEHHMLAIQPLSLHGAQEELRSIGVGSSVSHRQDSRSRVLEGKVLICKLRTIDGLTTSTIASCEVSTLRKLTIGFENGLARLQRQCCKTTQVPICINSWLNHWSHEFVLYKFWVQSFGRIWMGFGWLLLFSQSPPGTWNQGSRDGRQILWNEGVGQICPVPSLQCTSSGSSPRSLGRRQHEAPWWCGLPGCRRWSCPQVFCQDEIHENHENQKKNQWGSNKEDLWVQSHDGRSKAVFARLSRFWASNLTVSSQGITTQMHCNQMVNNSITYWIKNELSWGWFLGSWYARSDGCS